MHQTTDSDQQLTQAPLGQTQTYNPHYAPELLFPIERRFKREEIDVPSPLPFTGFDTWNAYELSWLNAKGKPQVAIAQFILPCESTHLIESKSFKLYLNSFNNTRFRDHTAVEQTLKDDLSTAAGLKPNELQVKIDLPSQWPQHTLAEFQGDNLDTLDIDCDTYHVNPEFLTADDSVYQTQTFCSDLLKSNCLVTGQPDWGSVQITYHGPAIDPASLLRYLVSFRNHDEFHEQCVERIFMDILNRCRPQALTVHAKYIRRGGLDINPIRSTAPMNIAKLDALRSARQ